MARPRIATLLLKPSTWVVPYLALWLVIGLLPIQPTDLDIFFWPSAKLAVHGHPLLVYAAAGHDRYPNANGPLALVPLSAVGVVVNAFGWLDAPTQRRAAALLVFSLFLVLMSREAVATIERIRGRPMTAYPRLFAYAVIALSPPVFQSVAGYGHIEQPIEIWLLLVAARLVDREQAGRGGATFALAVLSRSSAALLAVPLVIASWQRRPTSALRFLVAGGITGIAGLLPFVLADSSDVIHSLFTYRGSLVVGAGSIWSLTHGSGLEPVVKHWDIVAVAAAGLLANLWLATRPGGLDRSRLYAAMTLSSASFVLLAKTVWPYYLFEVFVLGTVWAFGRWRPADGVVRLIFLPLAITVFGLVAEIGSEQGLAINLVQLEGGAMFAMLGLTAAWVVWMSGAASRPTAGISMASPPLVRHGHGSERSD